MRPFTHTATSEIRLTGVLFALSDPIRLAIVRHLAECGESPCGSFGEGMPKSTLSRHYRTLREAGVIRTRSEGTTHQNALRREDLDARFPGLLDAVLAADAKPSKRARGARRPIRTRG